MTPEIEQRLAASKAQYDQDILEIDQRVKKMKDQRALLVDQVSEIRTKRSTLIQGELKAHLDQYFSIVRPLKKNLLRVEVAYKNLSNEVAVEAQRRLGLACLKAMKEHKALLERLVQMPVPTPPPIFSFNAGNMIGQNLKYKVAREMGLDRAHDEYEDAQKKYLAGNSSAKEALEKARKEIVARADALYPYPPGIKDQIYKLGWRIESAESSKKDRAWDQRIRDARIRDEVYAAARRLEDAAKAERDRIRLADAEYEARQRLQREIDKLSQDILTLEKGNAQKLC